MKISYNIFVCKHSSPPAQFSNLRCVDATGAHGHLKNLAPVGALRQWHNEVLHCRSKVFTRCKGCLGLFCKDTDRRRKATQRDCRGLDCPGIPESVLSERMARISRACVEAAETSRATTKEQQKQQRQQQQKQKQQQQSAAHHLQELLQEEHDLDLHAALKVLVAKTGLAGYVEASLHDMGRLSTVLAVHALEPIVARIALVFVAKGVLGLVVPKGKCLPLLDH